MKHFWKIYTFLERSDIPLWRYCGKAAVIAVIPSFLIVLIIELIVASTETNIKQPTKIVANLQTFSNLVIFAPIFETLILVLLIYTLKALVQKYIYLSVIVGLIFGLLHGIISAPIHFLGTFWTFFVLSAGFLTWKKYGLLKAYVAALLPHSLVNLFSFILIYLTNPQ